MTFGILAFEFWDAIAPFVTMGIQALDLVLVALIVYWLYRLTKGTSAIPVFLGLLAIYIIWQVVTLLGMNFMSEILGQFIAALNYRYRDSRFREARCGNQPNRACAYDEHALVFLTHLALASFITLDSHDVASHCVQKVWTNLQDKIKAEGQIMGKESW